MVRRFIVMGYVILFLHASSAFTQEEITSKTSIQAGYGTVTIDRVQWQRFSFRPDIPIGNFGLGLDLELFIDNEGKISDEGWDFSTRNKSWDTLIRKIYYARYGKPNDRAYVRAGGLDDVSLGYGLIMDNYRNTLNYPGDKKLGMEFKLRDMGTFGIGIEGMVNSFGDLKNDGAVIGTRVSARPLKPMDAPLLSKLTIGATIVRDINQYAGLKDSDGDGYPDIQDGFPEDKNLWLDTDRDGITDYTESNGIISYVDPDADGDNLTDSWYSKGTDSGFDTDVTYDNPMNIKDDKKGVTVWGLDAGIPLLEGPVRLDLYGQYAKFHTGGDAGNGGWGIGAPGLQLLVSHFTGRIEYRHFEGRFRPNFFDNLYENERVTLVGNSVITKEMSMPDLTLNGVFGRAEYDFFNFFSAEATYQNMTGDKTYQDLTGIIKILDGVLHHVPKISLAEGYYYNTYVDTDTYNLLDITANTLYGTRIGIQLAESFTVVWDTRYTFTPNGKGGFDRNRFVGIETVVSVR